MNIYIVRHAESYNNTDGRFCTHTNGDLTSQGELQAEYCRRALEHIKFDKIYSSHLIRAIRTAQIIRQTDHITQCQNLTEFNGGDYECKKWEEIDEVHSGFHKKLVHSLSDMAIPNGESYDCVKKRLEKFVQKELIETNFGEEANILIVSHGMTLRVLINLLMDKPDEGVNQIHWGDNTAITHIGFRKEKELYSLLSNQHLIDNGMDRSDYELWAGKEFVANKDINYIDL